MERQIKLNPEQQAMLNGRRGPAKQMAMRLLLDMAATAGAVEFTPIRGAHLSGVSPLTGGLGLQQFLARLTSEPDAQVAVPTTLNAAGCDPSRYEAMRIAVPGFLEMSLEIVALYTRLGVQPIQSCIPYEWEGVVTDGIAAWAESNAICFGNSYCGLWTNRESGLSALAAALTGYAPKYGLLEPDQRRPNLEVIVACPMTDPADFSILGDWIGKQRRPEWKMPYGPIPLIRGLPPELTHEQRKALTAAAANYGSPLLYIEGLNDAPDRGALQATLSFGEAELSRRYEALRPRRPVSLITIGCPQASVGELSAVARLLDGKQVASSPDDASGLPPLWVFTSSANRAIAERLGLAQRIERSGALLLENTCPEVVPYDPAWVRHVLTNSMKAEHYLKSGLNRIPTSVMRLADCIAVATGERIVEAGGEEMADWPADADRPHRPAPIAGRRQEPGEPEIDASRAGVSQVTEAHGRGLPSQGDFAITGEAFVSEAPITFLGFVNRETGVVEEPGHPADGKSLANKVAIFPRGTGSTVAPYVLLELYYRGKAPLAIVNTEIDQQSAPACSLEAIPYAFDFDADVVRGVQNGDMVTLERRGQEVTLRVLARRGGKTLR